MTDSARTKTPRILDCTIRDGSYVVDFQFTAEDTAVIAAGLERAGVEWIEIGHGLGLNASPSGKGTAAATDDEYLQATANALTRAKWGAFFIPGIGRAEDLERAAGYGMKFVRIGANAPDIAQTEPFVRQARDLGLHVSVNLMKSYVLPVPRIVELSRLAESYGAHVVSLVDSAGTMLPADVHEYVSRMRDGLTIDVGFHGHDNLALGIANVLAAIEAGAAVVDTTLQGIGRGGGNPVTEILVAVLHKQGINTGIDLNQLLDLSERVVRPLLKVKGFDPLNITSGYAGFHSSALEMILKHAGRQRIDPRQLIVEVSGIDRVDVTDALVEEVAERIGATRRPPSGRDPAEVKAPPVGSKSAMTGSLTEAAQVVAQHARSVATKSGRTSVFNLVAAPLSSQRSSVSPFVQEQFDAVIASAQIHDAADAVALVSAVDGSIDLWFADADVQADGWSVANAVKPLVQRSRFLEYRDHDTWVRAVERQIASALTERAPSVLVIGTDPLGIRLAVALAERGMDVVIGGDSDLAVAAAKSLLPNVTRLVAERDAIRAAATTSLVVGFARHSITSDLIAALPAGAMVFDAGIGSVQPDAADRAAARQLPIIRPDMRAVLAAEVSSAIGTARAVTELMGRGLIDDVPVVAGGLVGRAGEVVVDSITNPTRAIGVADGQGGVDYRPTGQSADRLSRVQSAIWRQKLNPELN
ncbi:MAG TPA: hypothetical protein VM096_04810 [Vicinamibacterales bacterium]|nr:hypothetical protein [Vicinamibacterales bacterium]